jgi:O-antigen ligase
MTISAYQAIFSSNENENLRSTILQIGFERNFSETLFGTGIGTTPLFLSLKTNGEIALGSFHNFFGTILFERGIIILILVVAFFINILFKIFLEREKKLDMFLKYAIFIIFITTTGAELFVNSRDFNIDMIVCLLFFELSLDPKMRNSFNKI